MDIAKLAAEKFLTRPFANRLAGLVALAGIIVIVGPPVAVLVASKVAAHFWQFEIPVTPPGPLDYAVGFCLVAIALVYSGWIHYVTAVSGIKQRQNEVQLAIDILDRKGELFTGHFTGELYTVAGKIPDYRPRSSGFVELGIGVNQGYYRDWFHFVHVAGNGIQLRFKVLNTGSVSARNVVVKVSFDTDVNFQVLSQRQLPSNPTAQVDYAANLRNIGINSDTTVHGTTAEFKVPILNPGDEFTTSSCISIRPDQSCTITGTARMFAEDLPSPIISSFEITAEITPVQLSTDDVVAGRIP